MRPSTWKLVVALVLATLGYGGVRPVGDLGHGDVT